jgi:hypothetical protein
VTRQQPASFAAPNTPRVSPAWAGVARAHTRCARFRAVAGRPAAVPGEPLRGPHPVAPRFGGQPAPVSAAATAAGTLAVRGPSRRARNEH